MSESKTAEISNLSPLPVQVVNPSGGATVPSFFVVGSAWKIQGTAFQYKITAVDGEWLQVETLTFVQTGSGGESQQFSGSPTGWIRPASYGGVVWEPISG